LENTLLDWAVASLPVVVSAVGVLVSLKAPHSRGHRALRVLLVVFGIAASGITFFRWDLEQRGCANILHSLIEPPNPIDWAAVFLPTLLAAAGVFVSLKAPNSRYGGALRVSLVVLGIAVSAGMFFWENLIFTPCFIG
jgi:hypothetical protein